ncbi:hypothetical protein ACET9C_01550 [Aeromonas veronii]|uniref:hypothetical protein n=1 Tax=Aeromonas veronii TaxID=654 RepID=UPI0038D31FD6
MIITIDDNYVDYLKAPNFTCSADEVIYLMHLLLSRKRGFNFIVASRQTLQLINNTFKLSNELSAILNKIYSEQTLLGHVLKRMNVRINIVSPQGARGLIKHHGISSLNVTLHEFYERELDKQANFIAENIYDIDVYESFIKSYLKSKEIRGVNLHFKKIIGGGSTSELVIAEQKKTQNGFNLCILDSDKLSPTSDFGDTYKKAYLAGRDADNLILIPTKSRELENIIPLSTLDVFFKTKANKIKVQKYKTLLPLNLHGESILKYLDFKKGVRKLNCKPEAASPKIAIEKQMSQLICSKPCRNISQDGHGTDCSCIVLDGFGSDLLKNYTAHIKAHPLEFNDIDEHCKAEWEYICDNALPVLIAPLPIRA